MELLHRPSTPAGAASPETQPINPEPGPINPEPGPLDLGFTTWFNRLSGPFRRDTVSQSKI